MEVMVQPHLNQCEYLTHSPKPPKELTRSKTNKKQQFNRQIVAMRYRFNLVHFPKGYYPGKFAEGEKQIQSRFI